MRRRIVYISLITLALIMVVIFFFLSSQIKESLEVEVSALTKTNFSISSVYWTPSGKIIVKGLTVENPEDYEIKNAIKIEKMTIMMNLGSIYSDLKAADAIEIRGLELTYEFGMSSNNLDKILSNIKAGGETEHSSGTSQGARYFIKKMTIRDSKIKLAATILGSHSISVPLPALEIQNIGTWDNGLALKEVMVEVFTRLAEAAGTATI